MAPSAAFFDFPPPTPPFCLFFLSRLLLLPDSYQDSTSPFFSLSCGMGASEELLRLEAVMENPRGARKEKWQRWQPGWTGGGAGGERERFLSKAARTPLPWHPA